MHSRSAKKREQNKSADQDRDGHPEMNVGENARERALPWGNFVGHVAFLEESAVMLGQNRAFIQWGDIADLGRSVLRPYKCTIEARHRR